LPTSDTHWLGLLTMLALTGCVGLVISLTRLPRSLKQLLYLALALRIVGAGLRHYMVVELYGTGDSIRYFRTGVEYAHLIWELDFASLLDPSGWVDRKWWGTQFILHFTGLVVAVIGESFFGGFILFSLLAFAGLVGFAVAFGRAYPEVPFEDYARWVWLFPSLWFWPASIGKEAVILLGLGLSIWGFVGKQGRIQWLLLGAGLALTFAVRVQVAAVLVVSLVLAQWLSFRGRWTLGRITQGLLILAVGLGTISMAAGELGLEGLDVESVGVYFEANAGRGAVGTEVSGTGSGIEQTAVGVAGIPMALVNILLRPFPWEARNLQQLVSGFEIVAFWGIVWFRRRRLAVAVGYWRSDRLLRVAVPFILVYSVSLGMVLANMGLIARQRIFLFPFLFLLIEAMPRLALARREAAGEIAPGRRRRGEGAISQLEAPA